MAVLPDSAEMHTRKGETGTRNTKRSHPTGCLLFVSGFLCILQVIQQP